MIQQRKDNMFSHVLTSSRTCGAFHEVLYSVYCFRAKSLLPVESCYRVPDTLRVLQCSLNHQPLVSLFLIFLVHFSWLYYWWYFDSRLGFASVSCRFGLSGGVFFRLKYIFLKDHSAVLKNSCHHKVIDNR